jgi:hypothetical protein
MCMTARLRSAAVATVCVLAALAAGGPASARPVRGTTRTSVNHNANINRNANVNRNTNVNANRNVNVHRDIDVDVDRGYYRPVGAAVGVAAATAVTAVAIGSIVNTLPPSCSVTAVNNVTYQNCGGTWYQPRYSGTQVSYVVVNPPH